MTDRSRDVSNALTEIRTVRSRAESALIALQRNEGLTEIVRHPASMDEDGYADPWTEFVADPDVVEMMDLLTDFIDKTAKFAKAGGRKSHHRPRRF